MQKAYSEEDGYELYDEREAYFAEKAVIAKARGKGAPKKKRTKAGMCFFLLLSCLVLSCLV